MAYTGTIVAEAEMTFMAGENVDGTGNVEANHNYLAGYAEAYLCALVKYDIVTNWASLSAKFKPLFTEWAARFAACSLIAYNMHGYGTTESTARIHAEDMMTMHWARIQVIEKILKEASIQDFLSA